MIQQQESNLGIFSLLGPSSSEVTNITNSIKNQVSQLITNTCHTGSNNEITNTNVFAQDPSSLNLTIAQSGSVNKAECALDTVAKLLINNDVTNSVTQTESSCGDILLILIIIAIIMLVIILFPLLRAISKRAASIIEPGAKEKSAGTGTKIFTTILIIGGIAGIGAGIYFFIKHIDNSKKS
jgi:hypothetical protein